MKNIMESKGNEQTDEFKKNLIVKNSIIRIIGVFEYKNNKKFISLLTNFEEEENDKNNSFLKNYWYPEFRDIMFLHNHETSSKVYKKKINKKLSLVNNQETPISFNVELLELFLFQNGLNFFTIEVSIEGNKLENYSNLTNLIRHFNTQIITEKGENKRWVNWIEENCLCEVKIENVPVDEYSGSKFKLYSVYDIENELSQETKDELLFDLGCVSEIGSAGGSSYLSPDERYYHELLSDKISPFKNYAILPLFDSITCIGSNILERETSSGKRKTWSDTYFRIVLYNLFLKYNLFRYSSKINTSSSLKVRDEFIDFVNKYNISHLSYNFLPNLIAEKHRKSLHIDAELDKFKERINLISQEIQEKEQKRSNLLLSFVSVIASLSGAKPIIDLMESFRQNYSINFIAFYFIISTFLFLLSIPILNFLFPSLFKDLKRKWKKK